MNDLTVPVMENSFERFRSDAYALLGSLLVSPPNEALLNWLQNIELDESCDSVMREAWSVLQLAARRADPDMVADEYQNLFIGLGRGELVPFASWYLTGHMMEQPLVVLRHDLQGLGFERDPNVNEPEDHIGALCQVMGMLVDPQDGIDPARIKTFFNQHIQGWSQRFFQDLQNASSAHFYSAVGRFGELFTGQETLLLEE